MTVLRSAVWFPLTCLLVIAGTSGCAGSSAPKGSAGPVQLYEMERYDDAYRAAVRQHRGAAGVSRERAALTAGLSAHALGRDTDAERWLRPLRVSRDPRVSGRAEATLGLIELSRASYNKASVLLSDAARALEGEPSARAHYHAAEAFALGGRPETARLHLRLALANTVDDELRRIVRERLDQGAYTVQLGAFARRQNADRVAQDVQSAARTLGLEAPVIAEHWSASGALLYIVRVGRFSSREEAERVRVRLGRAGVVSTLDR